jgi:hypothetical protein
MSLKIKYIFIFLIIYYLLLTIFGFWIAPSRLAITYFLFVIFSFFDIILIYRLFEKHKIIFLVYIILSYLLCLFLNNIFDYFIFGKVSLIKSIYYSFALFTNSFNNKSLKEGILLLFIFFIIFLIIKIIPCILSISLLKKKK